MKLSEIITPKRVNLDLKGRTKDEILEELVKLLRLRAPGRENLLKTLRAREELGSTGLGKGIAIPHCRSLVVSETQIAVGRSGRGVSFQSMDRKRAHLFFLIVAPPMGDPGDYLIALGAVAQMAKRIAKDKRFKSISQPRRFIKLIKELEDES
jgi:mannitol/fructose-specific phosphotransferase system IIA component (Ntr-type)